MTDAAVVLKKLANLREHLLRVRRRRPPTVEELRNDLDRQDAIALSLLVAIQEAADIAFHVVADEGWGTPSSYAEGFEILSRHAVIDAELAHRMTLAAGLRNRIAHGYASLDLERMWVEIPEGLDALERYVIAIARFLAPSDDAC
jgi:uncharacterized protein YutE (UPF0331/DUF86 family)